MKPVWEDFEHDIQGMTVKQVIVRLLDLPMGAEFKTIHGECNSDLQVVQHED